MTKRLYLLILSGALLASCGNPSSSSGDATSVLEESSDLTSQTSSASSQEDEFVTVEFDEEDYVSDGISTDFGDINVGRPMIVGLYYNYSFSYSHATAAGSTIRIVENGVCELDHISQAGDSFRLHGVKEGESILYVYDADGYLRYRNKITFRNAIDEDHILDFCFENVDHYESNFFPGAVITFVSPTELIYSGYDESYKLDYPIDFSVEYNSSDATWHYFDVIDWNNPNQNLGQVLNLVTIAIDQTGYWLHAYTRSSFVDWFTPVF